MKGIVRAVRWHDRIGFVWGPLTRWRDCLSSIEHISCTNWIPLWSTDVLIRRLGAGFSAMLEKSRVAGRVDGIGARSARGSWDVAVLRAAVEAAIIAQGQKKKYLEAGERVKNRPPSGQGRRLYSCYQSITKNAIGAKEGTGLPRGVALETSSGRRSDPPPPNYQEPLAASRGPTRGTGSLRSSIKVSSM